jgi:hypothetical protein
MSGSTVTFPVVQFLDDNGDPLPGGKVYTYETGTTTPKATYSNEALTIPNANPIILDSAGKADIWLLDNGQYRFVINTSTDVLVDTIDDVSGVVNDTNLVTRITETVGTGGFKNKIIGGDFGLNTWYNGTTVTNPGDGAITAARWKLGKNSTAVINVVKSTTGVPSLTEANFYTTHCLQVDVTTADASIANNEYMFIEQRIEGVNIAPIGFGQPGSGFCTLSFWSAHTQVGVNYIALSNGIDDLNYFVPYTQLVSNTPQFNSMTIPAVSSGTWNYANGIGLKVKFILAAGSDFHGTANTWNSGNLLCGADQVNNLASTANKFRISLVQLEENQTVTPFERRNISIEQQLVGRYVYNSSIASGTGPLGFAESTTEARIYEQFPVPLRATPTISVLGFSTYAVRSSGGSAITATNIAGLATNVKSVLSVTVAAGLTAGRAVALIDTGSPTGITYNAEL